MMRAVLIWIAAFALATGAAAQSEPLRALSQDYEALGWEAVGRLDLGSGFCTGTLISTRLVLTAAHCLYGADNTRRSVEDIVFKAGYRDGEAVAQARISRMVAHAEFDPSGAFDQENVSRDLALLELAQPIPTSRIDPFVLHSGRILPGPVSVVSYGEGRADHQSRQRACRLQKRFREMMLFDCDVTYGSSGSPVFTHADGRGRIISVISGMSSVNNETMSMGPYLEDHMPALRRALRAEARHSYPRQDKPSPATNVRSFASGARLLSAGQSGRTGAKFVKVSP